MKLTAVKQLRGAVEIPPDKSISQRAALFAALGDGTSEIWGYSEAADPQSALSCVAQLGIEVERQPDHILVHGKGLNGLKAPTKPLDCGNSGTAMRFLAGILAGQSFDSVLIGDESLSRRPMERIAKPLRAMGADISLTDGHAPIHIKGKALQGMTYEMPMASAQVKSCVLLAGIFAEGETVVIEKVQTRDHTERMLGIEAKGGTDAKNSNEAANHLIVRHKQAIPAQTYRIPRDFSAAAFFLVAGSIIPQSRLELPAVGMNPSRTALLSVLLDMGANITQHNKRLESGEPVADLVVESAQLHGITLDGAVIANLIDEIPILSVAATQATGTTTIRGAEELRVKETDRIEAMVKNLRALGATVEEFPDGMTIHGGASLKGATVETYMDHRIAMSMGVAALLASGETEILDAHHAAVSFPTFWEQLEAISVR